MDIKVITKNFVLVYMIEDVPFYVDADGDLTSNIQKCAWIDESKARALCEMYHKEGIDMRYAETESAYQLTI